MKHIPNDHVKTIVKTVSMVYREINSEIKVLIKNPSVENKITIKQLRKVRCGIGKGINI